MPLMINWLAGHISSLNGNLVNLYNVSQKGNLWSYAFVYLLNTYFYWIFFQIILFLDVFFFTIGYMIELPFLKNEIKSVDPTALGWIVCLACYPPFNTATANILAWYSSDFPQFSNITLHIIMNLAFLFLMGIYARASICLNFKASNLTNRGIVSYGVYKYVRHPAYLCKNTARIIGALPIIINCFVTLDFIKLILIFFSIGGWLFIYFMRAITEERHLLMIGNGYKEYKEKVKYRFIPGII
ncbi:MAG: isoprenylcysteine carboxylmethyltransferase family protein [Candidatus Gracilibacteria bacterium]|nr:isoprenylcysteine carboxylmethyltransferase family protein [Candidatus Gracilibacteria bacterium]MDD3120578.1 isoprenylcysteine carboxylmethyltransferase family protein [Candidatus Gracilibacteria bacterium]MDD4530219.1 isoprenylcysteine carboxylmethyltransferase family protein [Candidatus Gracilibacteria bacterium]